MFFPVDDRSIPNDDAISARLSDSPKPPDDISGANTTEEVNCLGTDKAITTPAIAPTTTETINDFLLEKTLPTTLKISTSFIFYFYYGSHL